MIALFCLFVGLAPFGVHSASHGAHWSYHEAGQDPQNWCALSEEYSACCEGKTQSPIDLITEATEWFNGTSSPLKIQYSHVAVTLKGVNNGHSVSFTPSSGEYSFTGGCMDPSETYVLDGFHFHWGGASSRGSEHTLDGARSPMELHLVHKEKKSGKLAVIGIFLEESSKGPAMDALAEHLKEIHYNGDETSFVFPHINELLPSNLAEYFCYEGSLTTPPCTEPVFWTVLTHPSKITADALIKFQDLSEENKNDEDPDHLHMSNNFRPTQPLNGRRLWGIRNGGRTAGQS